MPKIKNIPRIAITGRIDGFDPCNTVLIQISDPDYDHPVSYCNYQKIYQFKFFDSDENADGIKVISSEQAKQIAYALNDALTNGFDVLVHCHAGIARSGAVAEVGVMMGFDDTRTHRIPNRLVKFKLMQVMGWTYE